MILWIDLETTGLTPQDNHILEVAAILTDGTLEEVDGCTRVIHYHDDTQRLMFDPYVQDMHTENGLWDACKLSTHSLVDTEMVILQILRDSLVDPHTAILGGATINFDRLWMEYWMPNLFNYLHYRNFDISTMKRTVEIWRPDLLANSPESNGQHRARADIIDSINYAKFFRDFVVCPIRKDEDE